MNIFQLRILTSLANELFHMGRMAIVGFKLGEFGIYLCGGYIGQRFEQLRALARLILLFMG